MPQEHMVEHLEFSLCLCSLAVHDTQTGEDISFLNGSVIIGFGVVFLFSVNIWSLEYACSFFAGKPTTAVNKI